jgi:hypothetical protein
MYRLGIAIFDPLVEQLSLVVISPLRDGDHSDTLYLRYLAQMIPAHLARMLRIIRNRRARWLRLSPIGRCGS